MVNWATFGGPRNCKHAEWAWHAGHRWQAVGHGAMALGGFVGIVATGAMSFPIGGGARYLLEVCRGRAFSRRTEGGYREDLIVHRLMSLHEYINALLAAHGPQGPWLAQAGDALQGLRDDIKHHADRRVRQSELIPKALAVAERALGAALAGRPSGRRYLDGGLRLLPWEGRSSTAKPQEKHGNGGVMSVRST